MKNQNVREEELKNKLAQDYFWLYDCSKIIGNIDFCVGLHHSDNEMFSDESLLWAEAKKGKADIYNSFIQLILTIGKARTFDKYLPPTFLGAFDAEKIAFIPYNDIHTIFYQNDFNWKVTPSNYHTKEFKLIEEQVKSSLEKNSYLFYFDKDIKELKRFIKANFKESKRGVSKIRIDKNNFMIIYNKWLTVVKPTIAVDWDIAKNTGIIDGDFYLADLLSQENETLKEKLYVLLKKSYYELERHLDKSGMFSSKTTAFKDRQVAHNQFWNKYDRPPKQEYWDYIVDRRDLLVPQDVRERKGSFFTPKIWVEKSQEYLAKVLGEDWQDEYYVWDCAAGTGNLLAGFTNKYNIWASTLDQQDVDVMHDRIETMNKNSVKGQGSNLLHDHVFQFDFLNDEFTKLPQTLQDILNDEGKRKKLVVYINPPYAEGDNRVGTGRKNIQASKIHDKYAVQLEDANREIFAQFLIRIFYEASGCHIAEFSKLKTLTGAHFRTFRRNFTAKLVTAFIVPAWTFDNVKGKFPIGFKIWDTNINEEFKEVKADVFNEKGENDGTHSFYSYSDAEYISKWVNSFKKKNGFYLGWLARVTLNDFQSNNTINILNTKDQLALVRGVEIYDNNLIECCICFAVRKCIEATWLNDRDQFLYPEDGWQIDTEFQNNCFAFTLFSNNIQSSYGVNHWIPFTEQEVNSREKFESNFMSNFIKGKIKLQHSNTLFATQVEKTAPLDFSEEAITVFNSGRELWKYYHTQPNCNVNASLYDIREFFQGRNDTGKMNNKSNDEYYMQLITALRDTLKTLAKKIEPKVYEFKFLK